MAAGVVLTLLGGCGALLPKATPPPSFYSLGGAAQVAALLGKTPPPATAPTLLVSAPHAAPGFDSRRIIYMREAHKLEYFARHEWVDTPARMLAPMIIDAVERGGAFRAVVAAPSTAAGDLRLDTEIVRLQQDFGAPPSRVRFTLRAYVVENATRRVLATREFDATVAAASDDPYAGVLAAGGVVQAVLQQLARFCGEAAANGNVPK
jgi:cholesterol transport system auxiliary component